MPCHLLAIFDFVLVFLNDTTGRQRGSDRFELEPVAHWQIKYLQFWSPHIEWVYHVSPPFAEQHKAAVVRVEQDFVHVRILRLRLFNNNGSIKLKSERERSRRQRIQTAKAK